MKRLRFTELLLLSEPEKAARRVTFHPKATIIKGANDTGKSSILKSIYQTLGAEPPNQHPKWADTKAINSLRFTVDDVAYRMIRLGGRFALFDGSDNLIRTFARVTKQLSPQFARLFNFHLRLLSQSGEEQQAAPAFLFLPFYVDQDQGWTGSWRSFDRLRQFKNYKRDVAYFHTGIRPSEFYVAKTRLAMLRRELDPLQQKRQLLKKLLTDVETRIAAVDFSIDIEQYRSEIEVLLKRCNELLLVEEKLKRELSESFVVVGQLDQQIEVARHALGEIRQDRKFAGQQADAIECPVCHAEYTNGFADRFHIAVDEDQCQTLLDQLQVERDEAFAESQRVRAQATETQAMIEGINKVLAVRKEVVTLQELLRAQGQREMQSTLIAELAETNRQIGELDVRCKEAESEMQKLENRDRQADIVGFYRQQMGQFVNRLNVPNLPASSYKDIVNNIQETGSDLPRALLAYYYALLQTINKWSSSTYCPVVIDSPRQQDQDTENYRTMLRFIRDETPEDAQLVLAVQSDMGMKFGGDTIELHDKSRVLSQREWKAAIEEVRPLLEKALL